MSIPEGFVPVTLDLIDDYEAFRQRTPRRSADYTFTNPLLSDKFLNVWQENGTVRKKWRQCRN